MKSYLSLAMMATLVTGCQQVEDVDSDYEVDRAASKIEWKGSAPDHFHVGSFELEGRIQADQDGRMRGGEFIIPITSIVNYDLPDPVRQTLLDDLKSANFFDMAKYPDTRFKITKVGAYGGSDTTVVANANYLLTGDFTMLGQTHAITFPAHIRMEKDSLVTDAKLKLDRTLWGMNIYSDPAQKLYIFPDVNISLHVRSAKAAVSNLK